MQNSCSRGTIIQEAKEVSVINKLESSIDLGDRGHGLEEAWFGGAWLRRGMFKREHDCKGVWLEGTMVERRMWLRGGVAVSQGILVALEL